MFKIGPIQINQALLLAPMEDVTDASFRAICREMGAAAKWHVIGPFPRPAEEGAEPLEVPHWPERMIDFKEPVEEGGVRYEWHEIAARCPIRTLFTSPSSIIDMRLKRSLSPGNFIATS